jgi:hypothetical protein
MWRGGAEPETPLGADAHMLRTICALGARRTHHAGQIDELCTRYRVARRSTLEPESLRMERRLLPLRE